MDLCIERGRSTSLTCNAIAQFALIYEIVVLWLLKELHEGFPDFYAQALYSPCLHHCPQFPPALEVNGLPVH